MEELSPEKFEEMSSIYRSYVKDVVCNWCLSGEYVVACVSMVPGRDLKRFANMGGNVRLSRGEPKSDGYCKSCNHYINQQIIYEEDSNGVRLVPIYYARLDTKVITLEVTLSETILQLKQIISEKELISFERICIICAGKLCQDCLTLKENNIHIDSTSFLQVNEFAGIEVISAYSNVRLKLPTENEYKNVGLTPKVKVYQQSQEIRGEVVYDSQSKSIIFTPEDYFCPGIEYKAELDLQQDNEESHQLTFSIIQCPIYPSVVLGKKKKRFAFPRATKDLLQELKEIIAQMAGTLADGIRLFYIQDYTENPLLPHDTSQLTSQSLITFHQQQSKQKSARK